MKIDEVDISKAFKVLKRCVFCGNIPVNKTQEHIIPQWLIELTGDSNREIFLPAVLDREKNLLLPKSFSFNRFTLPACSVCNGEYSKLESKVKPVVMDLLNKKPISGRDLNLLLLWFDKIRVGLWLAFYLLNRNISGIEPKYYINKRIGVFDRAVFIYKSNFAGKRINFLGPQTPSFQYLPTCFSLVINNLCFLNMSTRSLISRRIGLPYIAELEYTNGDGEVWYLNSGREKVFLPLIIYKFMSGCTRVFQPNFKVEKKEAGDLYDTEYVKNMSYDCEEGIGHIFIVNDNKLEVLGKIPSINWLPNKTHDDQNFLIQMEKQTLELQNHFSKMPISKKNISESKKNLIIEQQRTANKVNKMIIEMLNSMKT